MGVHPGVKKMGGRVKGVPNKKTTTLIQKCEELKVDPFEILLLFAKGDWKALGYPMSKQVKSYTQSGEAIEEDVISPELRGQCAKEACQYLYPKRKAVELSSDEGTGFKIVVEDYSGKK